MTADRENAGTRRTPVLRSSKPPSDICFGALRGGRREESLSWSKLHELAGKKERGELRRSRCLLQIVCDDDDCKVLLQLVKKLFDFLGGCRVEGACGLVQKKNFRLVRQRPRDA